MMLKKIFIIFGLSLLAACSSTQSVTAGGGTENNRTNDEQLTQLISSLKTNKPNNAGNVKLDRAFSTEAKAAQLNKIYRQWVGTRYRLGGTDRRGIDCSAFMQEIFHQAYGIALPRSTSGQKEIGKKINKNELKQGDLVFFRKNNHVGVYLGNGKFMHASTSQGVTISSMDEKYWTRTYTQSRRVL